CSIHVLHSRFFAIHTPRKWTNVAMPAHNEASGPAVRNSSPVGPATHDDTIRFFESFAGADRFFAAPSSIRPDSQVRAEPEAMMMIPRTIPVAIANVVLFRQPSRIRLR